MRKVHPSRTQVVCIAILIGCIAIAASRVQAVCLVYLMPGGSIGLSPQWQSASCGVAGHLVRHSHHTPRGRRRRSQSPRQGPGGG